MDYIEELRNLKTNQKYGRKYPPKAILLLAIIDLYETNVLHNNEIKYDDSLKTAYNRICRRIFDTSNANIDDVYLPFWYMQIESFWHVIPFAGKDDILTLMLDPTISPSENKIRDCVKYVELDNDLYFLLTLPSGRSSLKTVLLENYTSLSDEAILRYSESDNKVIDYSSVAIKEYQDMLSSHIEKKSQLYHDTDEEKASLFSHLEDNIQICLNYEYFSYLKKNKYDRGEFLSYFPSVYDLYDKIHRGSFEIDEADYLFTKTCISFLSDLKISLIGEDNSMNIINEVERAIGILTDQEMTNSSITSAIVSNQVLEEIVPYGDHSDSQNYGESVYELSSLFTIYNTLSDCSIVNYQGKTEYATSGFLKVFRGKPYRFNYKSKCLTVKGIDRKDNKWVKGEKLLVAFMDSELFKRINKENFFDKIEDFKEYRLRNRNKLKYDGIWYDYAGNVTDDLDSDSDLIIGELSSSDFEYAKNNFESLSLNMITNENSFGCFVPKGQLKDIDLYCKNSYDYLWIMSIVDFMNDKQQSTRISFDNLACMMIANSWVVLNEYSVMRGKERLMTQCINYLIRESKDNMNVQLEWTSSKDIIYNSIKDYPMSGIFEDIVDMILESPPINILKAWIKVKDYQDIVMESINYSNACLYGLHYTKLDPYIEINPAWKNYLYSNNDDLLSFYKSHYVNYLSSL
ncbi:MAG: hypothetical protein SOZ58_05680 [Prevotella sp.]|nr:hypothetical protein [Prevotella sp.]